MIWQRRWNKVLKQNAKSYYTITEQNTVERKKATFYFFFIKALMSQLEVRGSSLESTNVGNVFIGTRSLLVPQGSELGAAAQPLKLKQLFVFSF